MRVLISKGSTVLFQGDSITDCERNRADPQDLGKGFPMMAASWFWALYPEMDVRFVNRGIGGDRTKDLLQRWDGDCIALAPTVVSILIGINNTWRRYDQNDPTDPDRFEEEYRTLLEQTTAKLDARLILCEPFLLPVSEAHVRWREDLDPKREVVRKLAAEFGYLFIPLDRVFQEACSRKAPAFWAPDGVHPSLAGHALIAQAWLMGVGALGN
jgi:acyl-CoA thioesterase-1